MGPLERFIAAKGFILIALTEADLAKYSAFSGSKLKVISSRRLFLKLDIFIQHFCLDMESLSRSGYNFKDLLTVSIISPF